MYSQMQKSGSICLLMPKLEINLPALHPEQLNIQPEKIQIEKKTYPAPTDHFQNNITIQWIKNQTLATHLAYRESII